MSYLLVLILLIIDSGIPTKGKHIDIVVGGVEMCGFCGTSVPIMLKKMGVTSAKIYDREGKRIYHWDSSIGHIEVPNSKREK